MGVRGWVEMDEYRREMGWEWCGMDDLIDGEIFGRMRGIMMRSGGIGLC